MSQFGDKFNLGKLDARTVTENEGDLANPDNKTRPADRMGLYDGERFVFEESKSSWLNTWRMWQAYGFNCIRFKLFIRAMLNDFDKCVDRATVTR